MLMMGPAAFDPSAYGYDGMFSIEVGMAGTHGWHMYSTSTFDVWRRYLRSMDAIEACRQHLSNIETYLLILTVCQIMLIVLASALLFVSIRFCQTCRRLLSLLVQQSSGQVSGRSAPGLVPPSKHQPSPITPIDDYDNNGDLRTRKYNSNAKFVTGGHTTLGRTPSGSTFGPADTSSRLMSRSRKLQVAQRSRTQLDSAMDETKPLAGNDGIDKDNFEYALIEKADLP